jgi:hypothetical protein
MPQDRSTERKRKMKDTIVEKTKERWHGKRKHGQLPRNLDEKLVDIEQSYRWLKRSTRKNGPVTRGIQIE